MYIQSDDDIFALHSSLSFDLTVTSIFAPLISGNCIKIYDTNQDEFVMKRILEDNCSKVDTASYIVNKIETM